MHASQGFNHIFEFTPESLAAWLSQRGTQAFRARQILEWVYDKNVIDPEKMTNLSKRDRDLLMDPADGLVFLSGRTIAHQRATDGTQKLLVQWDVADKHTSPAPPLKAGTALPVLDASGIVSSDLDSSRQTECVMIPSDDRRTACISSQVGCPVGCRFCASGLGGLDGNLSAGRIVEQVWRLRAELASDPDVRRITNVVFMGMGEPLANFQNVARAIRTLSSLSPRGMGIGARKITVSTVGLPKAIEKLAAELDVPVTLALSLHAPNDDLRRRLIPWAECTTIPELLDACQQWFAKTGREITLEYILLGGVNDRPEHARELADVAKTIRANINLIRFNEVRGLAFVRPEDADVLKFQEILRARGVNAHIRASRGRDIAAACGQLRHESSRKPAATLAT